jgi:hypothetical protein
MQMRGVRRRTLLIRWIFASRNRQALPSRAVRALPRVNRTRLRHPCSSGELQGRGGWSGPCYGERGKVRASSLVTIGSEPAHTDFTRAQWRGSIRVGRWQNERVHGDRCPVRVLAECAANSPIARPSGDSRSRRLIGRAKRRRAGPLRAAILSGACDPCAACHEGVACHDAAPCCPLVRRCGGDEYFARAIPLANGGARRPDCPASSNRVRKSERPVYGADRLQFGGRVEGRQRARGPFSGCRCIPGVWRQRAHK